MDILYFCPLWGSEHMDLEGFFKRVVNTGYDGVEIAIPKDKKFEIELRTLLDISGLKLIGHQHLPPRKETVNEYISRLVELPIHTPTEFQILANIINFHFQIIDDLPEQIRMIGTRGFKA